MLLLAVPPSMAPRHMWSYNLTFVDRSDGHGVIDMLGVNDSGTSASYDGKSTNQGFTLRCPTFDHGEFSRRRVDSRHQPGR